MGDTMKAIIYKSGGRFAVSEVPKPQIKKPSDVLIKVEVASICGSDLQILKASAGYPAKEGVVLGHEYVGIIEDVGESVMGFETGDRVVIEPDVSCGVCRQCRAGRQNLCDNVRETGVFSDGGFAQYSVMPFKAVHKVSNALDPEIAVWAEPLACSINGMHKANINVGETVVVLGAGPIGLLFIRAIKSAGAGKIIVSECMEARKEIARESGAIVIDPRNTDINVFVREQTSNYGADVVIDCVGSLLSDAVKCVRKGGKIVIFGINANAECIVKPVDIVFNELTIVGNYIAKHTFPDAINMLEKGIMEVGDMITHRFPLVDFKQALDVLYAGEAIKVLVKP
ncbi:MAG: alcohol dehydrogenase catalytic domain-containing protein [Eubacteriales bacterium]|nr:alcohol dehydrogenase catalytic domain-containing protein [Eubacteriales bacterium]